MARKKDRTDSLRDLLLYQLSGQGAHIPFEAAIRDFPFGLAAKSIPGLAHTAWGLLYHLHIAQRDMLEYVRSPGRQSPPYPSGYWPGQPGPKDSREWEQTIRGFRRDRKELQELVRDPARDLFAPLYDGSEWSLLQQAVLVIDHNSYHIGQLVDLRMLLGVPVRDW